MSGSGSRYLAGLCVASVGLVAGGWLVLTPFAFGCHDRERLTAWVTGAALAAVSAVSLACWSVLWRRRLRADGVLAPARSWRWRRSRRRQARAERLVQATTRRELSAAPDPAQVLTDLRELLTPLLADQSLLTDRVVVHEPDARRPEDRQPEDRQPDTLGAPAPDELLRGAELLVVGTGEEESW